jgi:hypothetical protein
VRLAGERLHTSSAAYVQGLQAVEYFDGGARIVLEGWLANAAEAGLDAFDMKEGLLATGFGTTRISKDGNRYNVVPFRHGGPRSRGTSFQRVGAAYGPSGGSSRRGGGPLSEADARTLGRKVWRAAGKANKTRKETGHGGRVAAGLAGKLKDHHKTDIFAGMSKASQTYAKTKGAHTMTFRAVSTRSDSRAFMHPGIEGRHLFRDAEAEIGATTKAFLTKAMEHLKAP